jgi:putative SOS response-associated peptidase YedK
MCGRYALILEPDGFRRWIANPSDRLLADLEREGRLIRVDTGGSDITRRPVFESYNIAPTQRALIVTNRDGERDMEIARWGLIPSWWRESTPPKMATFNARDDKLGDSGMWRGPIRHKRCLVPANGFYEWTGEKGRRVPHWIHREGGVQFAFAGLYDDWTNPETGEAVTSYTIITTSPNRFMEPIHDRMPVILDPESHALWLDPATDSLDGVRHLLEPEEWDGFTEYQVAPLKGDGPELIGPAGQASF